jgi:hypothetical protein
MEWSGWLKSGIQWAKCCIAVFLTNPCMMISVIPLDWTAFLFVGCNFLWTPNHCLEL